MTILSSPAPAGLVRRAALEASANVHDDAAEAAGAAAEADVGPSAADPLPIYSLALEVLASPSPSLGAAQVHGWRVLAHDRGGWSVVDFAGSDPTGQSTTIRRSGPAELLLRAGRLTGEAADSEAAYEPRILEVRRLGFSALWLHSNEAADRFFTLEEAPREHDTESMLAELAPRARRLASSAAGAASADAWSNELGG
jgi:hypothetical protein